MEEATAQQSNTVNEFRTNSTENQYGVGNRFFETLEKRDAYLASQNDNPDVHQETDEKQNDEGLGAEESEKNKPEQNLVHQCSEEPGEYVFLSRQDSSTQDSGLGDVVRLPSTTDRTSTSPPTGTTQTEGPSQPLVDDLELQESAILFP